MVANSKDVVIRFVGQSLTGPATRATISDLREVAREAKKGFGGALGGFAGGLMGGSIVGGLGSLTPSIFRQAVHGLTENLAVSDRLAKSFGIITEQAKALSDSLQDATKAVREETHKRIQGALSPSTKARADLLGGFSLPSGFPLSIVGGRQSMFAAALQGIRSERETLEKQKGMPLGAIQGRFFEQELRRIENNKSIAEKISDFGNMLWSQWGLVPAAGRFEANSEAVIARRRAQIRASQEILQRNEQFQKAQDELNKREQQLGAFGMLESGLRGLGSRGQIVGREFAGIGNTIANSIMRTFGALPGMVGGMIAMNRDMRIATESPAETLERELGNLEAQRQQGLSPENYRRRRRQLLMQGIAGLQDRQFNPLSAVESRTLTRGPDQKPVDDLKQIMHQDSENEQKLLRDLLNETKNRKTLEVVER